MQVQAPTTQVNNVKPTQTVVATDCCTQQQPVQQACLQQMPVVPQIPQTVQVPATSAGVNIQIFNPTAGTPTSAPTYNVNAPCYPSGYYTSSLSPDGKLQPNTTNVATQQNDTTCNGVTSKGNVDDGKKKEKRKIVELTDDYIRNLESYLNSQDRDIRKSAAKEVFARLEEDSSRADDKALNALINKMLQDPSDEIRFLALSALESRIVTGDEYTVNVLKNMQNSSAQFGQDAIDASRILLQMSGKTVEKEFEVTDEKNKNKKAK